MFELNKYLGSWYELMHYPSWFQRNDNYNTMATYTLLPDGTIQVHNSTISNGKAVDSYGSAKIVNSPESGILRVDFPIPEQLNLMNSGEFKAIQPGIQGPNYVIDRVWVDDNGMYQYAIVTDPARQSLYVLSRSKHPSIDDYSQIMNYVIANYDRDRLVQTPHLN